MKQLLINQPVDETTSRRNNYFMK